MHKHINTNKYSAHTVALQDSRSAFHQEKIVNVIQKECSYRQDWHVASVTNHI